MHQVVRSHSPRDTLSIYDVPHILYSAHRDVIVPVPREITESETCKKRRHEAFMPNVVGVSIGRQVRENDDVDDSRVKTSNIFVQRVLWLDTLHTYIVDHRLAK